MKRRTAKWIVALGILFFPITIIAAFLFIMIDEAHGMFKELVDDVAGEE